MWDILHGWHVLISENNFLMINIHCTCSYHLATLQLSVVTLSPSEFVVASLLNVRAVVPIVHWMIEGIPDQEMW